MVKIYHRRYPDSKWDYRAVSTIFNDKEVIYYHLTSNNKFSTGVEVYSGENYIVGDSRRSYSRTYTTKSIPKIYRDVVKKLISEHAGVIWSNEDYIDKN